MALAGHYRARLGATRSRSSCALSIGCRRSRMVVRAELFQLGDAWVATPGKKKGARSAPAPKGVIHFLGGAFIGSAPQVVYSVLLELIASAGYTVIATPYAVTFKHLDCADMVRQSFLQAVNEMRKDPFHAALVPVDKPVLGVGHSNGSLLHLLINARNPGATQANVIMSFNNKPVSEAIPLPGFLEAAAPTMAALKGAPVVLPPPDTAEVLRAVARLVPVPLDSQGQISNARLAIDQLGSVLTEMGDGYVDFEPSPAESRQIIQQGYDPAKSPVLLVRFSDDALDETREIAPVLASADPDNVSSLVLPGSHTTPCAADLRWRPGPVFTPFDALAQLAKLRAEQDVRRVGGVVVDFLDDCIASMQQAPPASPASSASVAAEVEVVGARRGL